MQIGEWIHGLALIAGWTVLISGGVALCVLLCFTAFTYSWEKIRDTYSFLELQKMVRHYHENHSDT